MEMISRLTRFPRKENNLSKEIKVTGRIEPRKGTENPMVYSLLQRKKAAHDWKPPDSESEVHGWAVSSNIPQESVGYLNHYFYCVDKKICFLCELNRMEYQNYPCRCTMWCLKCKLWATTTHPLPHACIICREEVDSFIHKESPPQEDIDQTVQNVHGGKRQEAALELTVYNQGRFKTEGLEFDVYNQGRLETVLRSNWQETGKYLYGDNSWFGHGIMEQRPIYPAMFKTGLNRGMFRTEPQRSWYGNNDQFPHGITDPAMFQKELSYADNCQLAHWIPPVHQGAFKTELCNKWQQTGNCPYGDKCQFAHGITELRPVIRHPSYKTEVCRTFLAGKTCPYGHRCLFRHSLAE